MDRISKHLVEYKNMGVVQFDAGLKITENNAKISEIIMQKTEHLNGQMLTDIFAELVGLESEVAAVLQNKSSQFRLDHINRQYSADKRQYFNFLILAQNGSGFLFIEDVTKAALQVRELNQHRYEGLLYQHSQAFRKKFLSDSLLGESPEIEKIRAVIEKLSNYPSASVLLLGESGTGKSLVARIIHFSSSPPESPFVEVNCAALPDNLIESELFGYEKGAFTNATTAKAGLLEEAAGGTVFLDEIGELPIQLQSKLLTVIETKKFRRLGSTKMIKVDLRIITATNRNLRNEVLEKRFREDLYYRLNIVSLTLPPLRSLEKDVLIIARHLLNVFNIEFKCHVKGFTPDAEIALLNHHWPGNVRELSNYIERAMIFMDGDYISASDLLIAPPAKNEDSDIKSDIPDEGINLEAVEKQLILSALEKANNNKSKAARLLGLTRDTLRYRLEKYQLI